MIFKKILLLIFIAFLEKDYSLVHTIHNELLGIDKIVIFASQLLD